MELRDFKPEDAKIILRWIDNEREFRLWSASRYENYPIRPEDMISDYKERQNASNFYPKCLVDDGKVVGHIIIRNPSEDIQEVRLGFIIVDKTIRQKGYGKILINKAIAFAKEKMEAKKITLGVFSNNPNAYNCYRAVGFKDVKEIKDSYNFHGESWNLIEMILE